MTSMLTALIAIAILFPLVSLSQNARTLPTFAEHEVAVYRGKLVRPKWIRFRKGDGWRDDLGKLVKSPEVNFAGKYFAALHSCGTGCRYYTLTDLTSGKELNALMGFGSGEEAPKTKEGYEYYEKLFFRPNSRLLVTQYEIGAPKGTECRERSFILEKDRLKPVTPTIYSCQSLE